MEYSSREITLENGRHAVIRSAIPEDAEMLLRYLKATASETPFLLRYPDEICMTVEEERAFIQHMIESTRDLMLIAEIDGEHAGNASFSSCGSMQRTRHRCNVAIALYRKYWGIGLGRAMLKTLTEAAKENGFEQAELQVCTGNTRAIALYQELGFTICGTLPHSMKYRDGSYADEYTMVKSLLE